MTISSCASGTIDPPVHNIIRDLKTNIPIVPVIRLDTYRFNEELLKLDKYCLFDYCEYEWNVELKDTHIFGKNTEDFKYRFPGDEWVKFDNWVKANPPAIYLKRELLEKDVTDKIVSSTYPCFIGSYPISTKEEFDNRPVELNHYWGKSSEYRVRFQGNAFLHSSEKRIDLVDNIYYLNGFLNERPKRVWVSTHIPHFARIPIEQLLSINGMSKLSLSMGGCGNICFRHAEAPVNSIMVMEDNDMAFPFKWIHGYNCIMYKGKNPIPAIEEALQRTDLYEIYLKGMENIERYRVHNYNKYLEDLINNA